MIPGYSRQVFVLTDGEVSNTEQVISLVQSHQDHSRVFALGLGEGASHELVEGIGLYLLGSHAIGDIRCSTSGTRHSRIRRQRSIGGQGDWTAEDGPAASHE